jgi:hypothetical protein
VVDRAAVAEELDRPAIRALVHVHVDVRRAPHVAEEGDARARPFEQLLETDVGAGDVAVRATRAERRDPGLAAPGLLDPDDGLLGLVELELLHEPIAVFHAHHLLARPVAAPAAHPGVGRLGPGHPLVAPALARAGHDPGDLDRAGAVGRSPEDQL